MEKFMTADEMRSFQRESLEKPSEEVSNLLTEIIQRAKHEASKNENTLTYWFSKETKQYTYRVILIHLEKLGYAIPESFFGNDVRGEWCSFVKISW